MAEVNIDVALESSVQELLALMRQGVTANAVKSVQRGFKYTDSSSTTSVTVEINEVDMSKSIILVEGSTFGNSGAYSGISVFVKEARNTSFDVIPVNISGTDTIFKFGWQVIEYY